MSPSAEHSSPDTGLGPAFVQRTIEAPGATLSHYEREGRGPPLVLIPGSFNAAGALKDIINHLDAAQHVVVVELRGHGGSWPPPVNGSIELFAQDVLQVLDRLRLGPCFVGGHSIGGMIAIEIARVRPQIVDGVISIEGWTDHHAQRDAFRDDTMSTLSAEQLEQREQLRHEVLHRWTDRQRLDFAAIWRTWDGFDVLRRTDLPILELYGDRGREPATHEQLHIPRRDNIELRWLPGASHSLPLECPCEVARLIDDFMRRCSFGTG
ncbi:MAG: alpha/beta hydrolase [Chloroflexi bacterium]|nr:alpha/beta hydrolase [Chloroflexota bacterium]